MPFILSFENSCRPVPGRRRGIKAVHAHFEGVGSQRDEYHVVLRFEANEGTLCEAVLTPLMAAGLRSEIDRVIDAGKHGRSRDIDHRQ